MGEFEDMYKTTFGLILFVVLNWKKSVLLIVLFITH